jgi:hypothetical protein
LALKGKNMANDFTEQDLDTPTEADLDSVYGTKYLPTGDVGTRKIKTKILKVRKEELRGKDDKMRVRFVLYFESLDKALVLNGVNKDELVEKCGKTPANWIGVAVGIYVDPDVMFGPNRVGGVRLRVLGAAQPEPKPARKPAPKPAAATEAPPWPEEEGDPGPEFTEAAE